MTPRLVRRLVVLLALALLAACGGGNGVIRRINPPLASVQSLAAQPDGSWRLTLRVQNFSTVPMRFVAIDAGLRLAGNDAGRIAQSIGLDIPGQSSEVIGATLTPSAAAEAARAVATGDLDYTLDGRIRTENPGGDFPFTHQSRLSPVPGRPGEYR